jgi:hypothetical protein
VEVAGASTANGANIQQWTNNNQTCGQWKFVPVTKAGSGTGLTGNYFNGMNFQTSVLNRVDSTINFNWGTGSPDPNVNSDQFSVRWTGQIQPLYTDTYTFDLNSDNGRRLWVNNQLIIDQWIDNVGDYTGTIALTAGQKYDIRVEYFEDNGAANCVLQWSSFLQGSQLIPKSQLYPNALPTISVTAPANNALYSAPATINITATAADADGSVAQVDFYNGSTLIGTDFTSPYTFAWNNVAGGKYNITALATDNRGGVQLSSIVPVIVDRTPTVSITAPLNNANYIATASILVTAIASDSDGTVTKVDFYNGSNLIGTSTTSPYSLTWSNVGVGTYTITAKATDNLGIATNSTPVTVTVKANQPPIVSITSPSNNSIYVALSTITVSANASDLDGSVGQVQFFNGSALLGTSTTSPYNFTWSSVPAGTYTITAIATDNLGAKTTSASVKVIVNQPPTVSITSPSNNAVYTALSTITVSATAADSDGSVSQVQFFNGSTLLGTSTTSPYNITWDNVSVGTYTITAIATDNLGAKTTSSPISLTVKANQPPTVYFTSPSNNLSINESDSITFKVIASDSNGVISQVQFYNGTHLLGTSITSPYNFTWKNLLVGTYTITAIATDNWGLTSTSPSIIVTVSTIVTGITKEIAGFRFDAVVVPNPAINDFTLKSQQDLTGGTIKVLNSLGIEVLIINEYNSSIDISTLASGAYFVVWSQGNNTIIKQFVKL